MNMENTSYEIALSMLKILIAGYMKMTASWTLALTVETLCTSAETTLKLTGATTFATVIAWNITLTL